MKFSVLLPTRNRLELLKLAVTSVLGQDYGDFELIVSDNNSDQPVRQYIDSLRDERVVYTRCDSTVPVTANWNNALARATGDYWIMLGDDDALCTGALGKLAAAVQEWQFPDCIYSGAYMFTYKGVIPGADFGEVHENRNAGFRGCSSRPSVLSREHRLRLVNDAMNFYATYGLNMQYVTVSRRVTELLSRGMEFFQTEYPDYFAMNNLVLNAERFLVLPQPLVVIGVSKSSFGWYYQNGQEAGGNAVLSIESAMADSRLGLESSLLPGTTMNTNWLTSMIRLHEVNGDLAGLCRPNLGRYRLKQLIYCALLYATGEFGPQQQRELAERLSRGERLRWRLLMLAARCGSPGRHLLSRLHVLSQKRLGYVLRIIARRLLCPSVHKRFTQDFTVLDAERLVGGSR